MLLLLTIMASAALIALIFLRRTVRGVRRRHFVRAGGSCLGSAAFASIAGAAFIFAFSYYGYGRLVEEQVVAEIDFLRVGPDEFRARMMLPGESDRIYELRGNEWQLDARLVIWTPPATILGLDPIYQLERISGRFSEIDRERDETRTVHSLTPSRAVDVWTMARRFPVLLPGVDAHYGSATYVPMRDGARFAVSLTRDALIARPANDVAADAVGNWSQ